MQRSPLVSGILLACMPDTGSPRCKESLSTAQTRRGQGGCEVHLGGDVHGVADARGLRKGEAVQTARQQVPAAPDAAARNV